MADTTILKVSSHTAPKGPSGQKYLAIGKSMSMRLWENEQPGEKKEVSRDYETVGFVIKGKAELYLEGQMVILNEGDSWLVPKTSKHFYKILEPFTAVESTHPPAEIKARDLPSSAQ